MIGRSYAEALVALGGNLAVWIAHTEQMWFPMASAFVRYLAPMYGLPDLRGPFLAITMAYLGLRLADWFDKREELDENL